VSRFLLTTLALLAACGTPTAGTPSAPTPTGTLLFSAPNGDERGAYLINAATGAVTKIATRLEPIDVLLSGGYGGSANFVYGTVNSRPRRIARINLANAAVDTILTMRSDGSLGAYDLSRDGRTMAIQTGEAEGVRLWTVDLASGTWTQRVDAVSRLDSIPLTGLRWTPDGAYLYALTEEFPPGQSRLIRLRVSDDHFEILTPATPISAISPWLNISDDGRRLAVGSPDGRLVFRDLLGNELSNLPTAGPLIGRPVFSPDGQFVVLMAYSSPGESRIEVIRLVDGVRFPLPIQANYELWVVDWF